MSMTFEEAAEGGFVRSLEGTAISEAGEVERLGRQIEHSARFAGRLTIGEPVRVDDLVVVGAHCYLGDEATIKRYARLEDWVTVERQAVVGAWAVLFNSVTLGERASVGARVIIGPGVIIPERSQIGDNMLIPDTRSIMTLGPLGLTRRTMTIHGAQDGPRFSAGCQNSVSWDVMKRRIMDADGTSVESAAHYRQYFHVIKAIGRVVQANWQDQADLGVVERLTREAAAQNDA